MAHNNDITYIYNGRRHSAFSTWRSFNLILLLDNNFLNLFYRIFCRCGSGRKFSKGRDVKQEYLKGRSVLDNFVFENYPFDEPKKMLSSKRFYLLRMLVKNAKWWSKANLPLSQTAQFVPFKRGFKQLLTSATWNYSKLNLVVVHNSNRTRCQLQISGFSGISNNFWLARL